MKECAALAVGVGCGGPLYQGESVQVDPMKPKLKLPGTKRLKLKYDELVCFNLALFVLSNSTCAATSRWEWRSTSRIPVSSGSTS